VPREFSLENAVSYSDLLQEHADQKRAAERLRRSETLLRFELPNTWSKPLTRPCGFAFRNASMGADAGKSIAHLSS